jgi:hypothetical protein
MSGQFSETNESLQVAFDNTSLSIFKACPRKYKYSIVDGWRSPRKSPPLIFGGAYHDVLEHYELQLAMGAEPDTALHNAVKRAFELSEAGFGDDTRRTRLTLIRSLVWYADQYKNDSLKQHIFPNGKVALEMSFRFELPFSPTGSNSPYIYCGHMDKLATYNSALWTVERKHTTSTLNEQFFQRYYFSSQIGGYVYAGKVVFDTPVAGAIIEATQVAVNFSRFGRVVSHRVNDHLEEWMEDTKYWIKQIEYSASHESWPHNTESCSDFGGCQFRGVCGKAPGIRQMILEADFVKDRWNPLDIRGDI